MELRGNIRITGLDEAEAILTQMQEHIDALKQLNLELYGKYPEIQLNVENGASEADTVSCKG